MVKPKVCSILLLLSFHSFLFSMESDSPDFFGAHRGVPLRSQMPLGKEEGQASRKLKDEYVPKGYYSDEEQLDEELVRRVIEGAPEDVQLVVDCVKDQELFAKLSCLKRMLLFGPSGNGKTLLAKAVGLAAFGRYYFVETDMLLDSWKNCHQNLRKEIEPLVKKSEPIAVIFNEMDQLTDQYKNKNSSDSHLPTALWTLLDYCEREAPFLFFIGTTNNDQYDFPKQLINRMSGSMFEIKHPDFNKRLCVIDYHIQRINRGDLSQDQKREVARLLDGRSCREIVRIFELASCYVAQSDTSLSIEKVIKAIKKFPLQSSDNAILAREMGVSIRRLKHLKKWRVLIELNRELLDYHFKKATFHQQRENQDMQEKHFVQRQMIEGARQLNTVNHAQNWSDTVNKSWQTISEAGVAEIAGIFMPEQQRHFNAAQARARLARRDKEQEIARRQAAAKAAKAKARQESGSCIIS